MILIKFLNKFSLKKFWWNIPIIFLTQINHLFLFFYLLGSKKNLQNLSIHLNTFWFIDPVTDIVGRFLSWLGSRIFTFGNVSRDTFLIIGLHHRGPMMREVSLDENKNDKNLPHKHSLWGWQVEVLVEQKKKKKQNSISLIT